MVGGLGDRTKSDLLSYVQMGWENQCLREVSIKETDARGLARAGRRYRGWSWGCSGGSWGKSCWGDVGAGKKKRLRRWTGAFEFDGAEGESRTPTRLPSLGPEPSVSTNSTTSATGEVCLSFQVLFGKMFFDNKISHGIPVGWGGGKRACFRCLKGARIWVS